MKLNIGAADGINRIRVQGCSGFRLFQDSGGRSVVLISLLQSAGSASTGFLAQGGLGKIDLEWAAP